MFIVNYVIFIYTELFNYNGVSPHRPDRHSEGTDSDLDKILHISSDSQKARPKFEVVITF